MPLKPGKKNQGKNIGEMMNSDTFAADKSPEKRQQMAVAASYEELRHERSKKLADGLKKKGKRGA
jgi:hypothetical protein